MKEDDFWDIDKLLPHKPAVRPTPRSVRHNISMSEINSGKTEDRSISLSDILKTAMPPAKETQIDYSEKSIILCNAVIADRIDSFSYSDKFHKSAHEIHTASPKGEARCVPFFSYMPQYSDLTSDQYEYYLTLRSHIRRGEYQSADSSYIFLYIYEIFALDDVIEPRDAINIIVELWKNYRSEHRELDKYLCDWLVDYAIIHNCPLPFDRLSDILPDVTIKQQSILFNMYLFDYVFSDASRLNERNIRFSCEVMSNYNPFKGKNYALEEYKAIFDKCIPHIFEKLYLNGFFDPHGSYLHRSDMKVTRPAYLGAVCSAQTKKNLTITYYPCISNELIRTAFSNVLKHLENKIRAALGMRNRLSNIVLPDDIRHIVDDYMNANFPAIPKVKPSSEREKAQPEKIKKIEVNIGRAKAIEDFSWQTTEKLTEGLEIEDDFTDQSPTPVEDAQNCDDSSQVFTAFEKDIIRLILKNAPKIEIEAAARSDGLLPDAAIDGINEKALEIIGDTVIDTADYSAITDYIDELSAFCNE